ncbi:hypothetical protein FHX82_005219 [Amycolatopsis bartoniae]|nr:hypothetical protein [Amycolatopsis bartoniae]MBB2938143.1 hypothetical protein [Amycolatopsis bartoniae]TVT03250.1 hypothetical protein FNH07_26010 [Amycolatopsis bartoniae]
MVVYLMQGDREVAPRIVFEETFRRFDIKLTLAETKQLFAVLGHALRLADGSAEEDPILLPGDRKAA